MIIKRTYQDSKWEFMNYLIALLLIFAVNSLHAQSLTQEGIPLITDASQLSSNASDKTDGQHLEYLIDGDAYTFWHSDWRGQIPDLYHYIQVDLQEEFSGVAAVWVIRRDTPKDHVDEFLVQGSVDGVTYTDIAQVAIPSNGACTSAKSEFFTVTTPVKHLRFTCTHKTPSQGNYWWHTAEFQVYAVNEDLKLLISLDDLLLKYDAYLWGDKIFNLGYGYGQYSNTDAATMFMENLKKADNICAGDVPIPSEEEVKNLIQATEDAYEAVIGSEVLFQIPADGYYRIVGHMPYYEDTNTGEKDADGNDIIERTYVTKAMYSDLAGYGSWGTYDKNDCRFVWKLTKDSENPTVVDMVNAATEFRFKSWSNPITMSEDGQLKVVFDWVGNEDGRDVLYLRNSSLARNPDAQNYLHQKSHNRGAGTGDNLMNWKGTFGMGDFYTSDKGTSEWYLEPVSEEEAQALIESFSFIKNHDLMILEYKDLISKSESAILNAQDASQITEVHTDQPLITEVSQFSSSFTDGQEGTDLAALIDGDANTYWHTDWHGSHPNDPVHYLNVELPESIEGSFCVVISRRKTANDHVIKMQVDASNDGENWTDIARTITTYEGTDRPSTFSAFTLSEPYKFIRFGALDCTGSGHGFYTYWHAAEFQLYPATIAGKTPFENMGEIGTNLESLMKKAEAQSDADITVEDYLALKEAYEAFMSNLVDPALTTALNEAKKSLYLIQTGNAPGFWSDENVKTQVQVLLDEVQLYIQGGQFDKAKTDNYIQKLQDVKSFILAQANKVDTNKWYRIRHMKQDEFTLCGATTNYPNLYGRYIAVGYLQQETTEDGNEVKMAHTYSTEQTREGQNLYTFDEGQIQNFDAALFRFVELPDGRFAIQNKASGLYISRGAEESPIFMGFTPQSFELQSIGYGQVLLVMKNLDGSTFTRPNLNIYSEDSNSTYSIVRWWNDTSYGCNSTFIIEEVEDVEEYYVPYAKKDIVMGQFYPIFCPETLQPSEGTIYEMEGTFVDEDKNYVAMNETEDGINHKGVPFVYMLGTPSDYNKEDPQTHTIEFQVGTDFDLQTSNKGGLIGTYSNLLISETSIVFNENMVKNIEGSTDNARNILAGSAYINFGQVEADASGDYSIVMEIGGEMKENPFAELGKPLITNVSQLSSNASDSHEGTNIGALIDGSSQSFWHTDWHGEFKVDYQYLQVELNEAFTGEISMVMVRRNTAEDHPTKMKVLGSFDGENYFEVTTVELPCEGALTTVISEPFNIQEPLKFFRFVTIETGPGKYKTFWHAAEFQLYGIKGDAVERIEETKTVQKGIFTINGIQVEKTQQGLYIIDGKKVLVK